MDPNEIELKTINKLFEYEKQTRIIDNLNEDQLKIFCRLYCKLYLKQQETISSLGFNQV
jgi:hypothetical protein